MATVFTASGVQNISESYDRSLVAYSEETDA